MEVVLLLLTDGDFHCTEVGVVLFIIEMVTCLRARIKVLFMV